MAKETIKLSPSSLNLFLECPRCFWLRFNKRITRPETPASTMPLGMDLTLKNYYDAARKDGLPPELKGRVDGRLLSDEKKIVEMRKTSFGFQFNSEVWFGGGLDEALELPDQAVVPLDNKSRGFPLKETHWTHKKQMSGYTLILREKGIKTKNLALLVYWFLDHKNMNPKTPLGFQVRVEQVDTDPDGIGQSILEAVSTLKGPIPEAGQRSGQNADEPCSFCEYRKLG